MTAPKRITGGSNVMQQQRVSSVAHSTQEQHLGNLNSGNPFSQADESRIKTEKKDESPQEDLVVEKPKMKKSPSQI